MLPQVEAFFDSNTSTVSYVVFDRQGGHAALIDTVLDYDAKSGRTSTASADRLIEFVAAHTLKVEWILETHAHADHLSAAAYLKAKLGGKVAIGQQIHQVQRIFKPVFGLEADFAVDGSQFDVLFVAGEVFQIGQLSATVLSVPGHTPADIAYLIADALFVGDTLFMPDVGSARCDFPGGDAALLYDSIQQLLALPDTTRVFVCHDYLPAGRSQVQWQTSIAEQRKANIHLHQGISKAAFIAMREARDKTLDMPQLILPAIQINIRAGGFPEAEADGQRYLKIPLDVL
ncbi:MBL fold metallo-hydrolase [Janthinobacterium sp. B9-8]|uniref:MBL fold metallo-hydrolase n=1 Tax=Janthinobacterium sp. B9-8 TaxID=1236179 RepID=UPI00061D1FA5|nr:MBL fold metallo-hydrolase [Janthinobacterium sp. B9-8]AMC36959.1 MBL fold metallo-hydrolase [Janthinobacterium sp. B9-8]